ncbi:hypothetical protein PINS_up005702 [Pythium insidiosum]|nr:hypothetical protein PINS_up005702 [Pythium insidiosum]
MLMSNVLTPGHGIVDDDELLWTVIQDVFLWDVATSGDVRPRPRLAALPIAEIVLAAGSDAEELASASPIEVDAMSTVLAIRQSLYLSTILDSYAMSLAAGKLVQFHWKALQRLSDAVTSATSAATAAMPVAQTLASRHLECLLVLASRRASTPSIDTAFLALRAVRSLLEALDCRAPTASSPKNDRPNSSGNSNSETESTRPVGIPALDVAQLTNRTATIPSRRPSDSDRDNSGLGGSLSRSASVSRSMTLSLSHELLRGRPELHALTVLVVLACVLDGHRLDQRLVPRYFLPPDGAACASNALVAAAMPRDDVLWRLQRHLEDATTPASVHLAIRERLQRCTLLGLCGSAATADALRVLTTLVLPDSFHSALYALPPIATVGEGDESPQQSDGRTYLAKGAFATVYRASSPFFCHNHSSISSSSGPAIKELAHQRSSGDLCVAAEVFHEINVLRRLQGNAAATQLLDFGSRRDTQSFELVLECCEATLSDWRQSLAAMSTTVQVPFRALVRLSLEVFLALGRVLQRIHAQSICHFDVKVLSRSRSLVLYGNWLTMSPIAGR